MKKFYYKKEDTPNKTPLTLERRKTVSKDGKEEVENRLYTRTSSLGSVDQLKDSLRPRIQSREITKCLSEDVLSRSYKKNPEKVITERELAASRLYKTRKASVNSKDYPQQVSKKDDLSPATPTAPKFNPIPLPPKIPNKKDSSYLFPEQVTPKNNLSPVSLKDPKFKPVPVPPKDSRKKGSSCLCYVGVCMAISLCTIGFLAAVAGLLYSEIFTNKNSTSHRLQESLIDLTNLVKNNSVDEHLALTNATFARKISFESDDSDSTDIRRSGSNLIDSENIKDVQFRQMDMTDLSRLLDTKQAEIKFQDRDTTIFEVNSSSSTEQASDFDNLEVTKEEKATDSEINISETDGPDILNTEHVHDDTSILKTEKLEETESSIFDSMKQRKNSGAISNIKQGIHDPTTAVKRTHDLYANGNLKVTEFPRFDSEKEEIDGFRTLNNMKQDTDDLKITSKNAENDSSKNIIREDFKVIDKKTEVKDEKIKYTDGLLNSQFNRVKDSSYIDHNLDLNLSDKKPSDVQDHSTNSVSVTESDNQLVTFPKNTDAVLLVDKNTSKPSVKLNNINVEYQTVTVSSPKDKVVWKVGDPIKVSNVNESELGGKEISSKNIDENASDKTEHDVEIILEVVNEPGDNEHDTVNRNGDLDVVSQTFNGGQKPNLNMLSVKSEDGNSSVQLRTKSQSLKDQTPKETKPQDQPPKETLRVKPLNMKVSLAEAMKKLQVLDVNNKALTSRMKSSKPLVQREREKPSKLKNKPRKKENINADRMQYLHNLRLALQGNFIGM